MKNNESHSVLVCPICEKELVLMQTEKTCSCVNNHNFDVAKQGYVNLLINSHKKSKLPGDSKEMILARTRFLSKGYYSVLSEQINECILKQLAAIRSDSYNILDIGCGEGYYTNELMRTLQKNGILAYHFGLDISKEAVKHASTTNKAATWIVANSFYTPFRSDSFDCIFSVFSPVKIEECKRIMKENGVFVRVLPGINHLIQIRDIIYDEVIISEENEDSYLYEGMILIERTKVCFDVLIGNEDLISLVKMTPHFWKTSKADKEPLNNIAAITVTIDMQINVYKKN